MDMQPTLDCPWRRRRPAVLALRLDRFLPFLVPRQDGEPHWPPRESDDHACNTELTSNCV